jgi:hypothetical protein
MSQSSMQSAPSAIAETSVMTFAPAFAAPGRSPRSTVRSTSISIPRRCASVAVSTLPASATARSSSNSTVTPSNPTGASACTMKVTSCAGPDCRHSRRKALLRRSFFVLQRTEPTAAPVNRG